MPIWIGATEATAFAVILESVELPRPGPHHFAAALLGAAGGEVPEVRIVRLTDSIFFAQAVLADGTRRRCPTKRRADPRIADRFTDLRRRGRA